MNISKISMVKFGYNHQNPHPQDIRAPFYKKSDSEKLNIIYDMLMDVRLNQENTADTLTRNQQSMHLFNCRAFQYLTSNDIPMERKHEMITDTFEHNRIGIIPSMDVRHDY